MSQDTEQNKIALETHNPSFNEIGQMSYLKRPQFNPELYELDPNFRLTNFADLKGWGCKIPQPVLENLLRELESAEKKSNSDPSKIGKNFFTLLVYVP